MTYNNITDNILSNNSTYLSSCNAAVGFLMKNPRVAEDLKVCGILSEVCFRLEQVDCLYSKITVIFQDHIKKYLESQVIGESGVLEDGKYHRIMPFNVQFDLHLYLECLYIMAFRAFDTTTFFNKRIFNVRSRPSGPRGLKIVRNVLIIHPENSPDIVPVLGQSYVSNWGDDGDFDIHIRANALATDRKDFADPGLKSNMAEFKAFWLSWINENLEKLGA